MTTQQDHRILLVWRKTRLQELVERFNTWPQAKFYLEHNDADAQDYLTEHDLYQQRLREAETSLNLVGRVHKLERRYLPSYQFRAEDIVVVVGQDGLVANTLKYLTGQPVIAANPDPQRWDGLLLPFEVAGLQVALQRTLRGKANSKTITFAEVQTNDGQLLRAVNDLFIGPQSHTSARYVLDWDGRSETQSSSGIIVSTGFGSTGWLQSIVTGANGVAGPTASAPPNASFAWHEQRLQFTVREPFPSKTTGVELVYGAITPNNLLRIESRMPERGVIFSDGIEQDYLHFNAGTLATVGIADIQGQLIVE